MIVSGVVQGVGFRWHVLQAARGLGLCGTARNLRDGKVEVWAEGEQEKLVKLVAEVWRGPALARVRDLDLHWSEARRQWTEFEVIV